MATKDEEQKKIKTFEKLKDTVTATAPLGSPQQLNSVEEIKNLVPDANVRTLIFAAVQSHEDIRTLDDALMLTNNKLLSLEKTVNLLVDYQLKNLPWYKKIGNKVMQKFYKWKWRKFPKQTS